jgi:indole-3-acetate monooxygenase
VRKIGGLEEHPYSSAGPSFIGDADSPFRPDASLLDAARMLGPVIREHSDFAEREGRLARSVIDAMRAAGMYRLMTPRTLGGLEIDPITFALIAEELAGVDSAAAWSLQAGNTGAWWASHFSKAGIAELFADGPDLLITASFSPPHRAEEVAGGYRLTGRGPIASTIHDCPWLLMTGMVFDGDTPQMTASGPEIVRLRCQRARFTSSRPGGHSACAAPTAMTSRSTPRSFRPPGRFA